MLMIRPIQWTTWEDQANKSYPSHPSGEQLYKGQWRKVQNSKCHSQWVLAIEEWKCSVCPPSGGFRGAVVTSNGHRRHPIFSSQVYVPLPHFSLFFLNKLNSPTSTSLVPNFVSFSGFWPEKFIWAPGFFGTFNCRNYPSAIINLKWVALSLSLSLSLSVYPDETLSWMHIKITFY